MALADRSLEGSSGLWGRRLQCRQIRVSARLHPLWHESSCFLVHQGRVCNSQPSRNDLRRTKRSALASLDRHNTSPLDMESSLRAARGGLRFHSDRAGTVLALRNQCRSKILVDMALDQQKRLDSTLLRDTLSTTRQQCPGPLAYRSWQGTGVGRARCFLEGNNGLEHILRLHLCFAQDSKNPQYTRDSLLGNRDRSKDCTCQVDIRLAGTHLEGSNGPPGRKILNSPAEATFLRGKTYLLRTKYAYQS